MRIIDADELKALRELYIQGKLQFVENEYDLIDKCPTIDAEPVRHGRWIRCKGKSNLWYCSECGEKILYNPNKYYLKYIRHPLVLSH